MIEKPKRPKKISNQDNKQPQTIQELIRRYDLDNTKIYDFLDELVVQINLKEKNNNIRVDKIESQAIGTVLYEDATGTTGDITLSETVSDFSEIKICYERTTSAGVHYSKSITVDRPEGKKAVLDFVRYVGSTEIIQLESKIVSISGTSITVDGSRLTNITSIKTIDDFATDTSIYITKIIGYR